MATFITATGNNVNSVTTGTVTPAAGDTLYCQVSNDHTITVNTPSGYTKQNGVLEQGAAGMNIFTKENVSAGSTSVTVTFGANDFPAIVFGFIDGTIGASSVDTGSRVQTTDATSPYTQTSNAFAQASTFVLAGCGTDGSSNPMNYAESLMSGTIVKEDNGSSFWSTALSYSTVASTSAQSVSWTHSGTSNGACLHIIGVKLASAAVDQILPVYDLGALPSKRSKKNKNSFQGQQSGPVGPDSFEAKALYHDALPPIGKLGRGYEFDLQGFQRSPTPADNDLAFTLCWYDNAPDSRRRRAFRGYKYDLQGFQAGPLSIDNTEASSLQWFDNPPIGGRASRGYKHQLEGWQYFPIPDDNDPPAFSAEELAPFGRNYKYELEGWQKPTVGDDNSEGDLLHFDNPPIGRNFEYELEGFQFPIVVADNTEASALYHADLPPIGRNFNFDLKGWQYFVVEAPPVVSISIIQATPQTFFDNVDHASLTITGVTAHNHLTAFFQYADGDNSPSKSAPTTPTDWLVAENPSGPIDPNPYMGQCAIYYKEDVAAGSHTIDFPVLRPGTYCEITIVETAGLSLSNSLDVHANAKSPNNTTVEAGQVGPTDPTTFANSIVFTGINVGGGSSVASLQHPPSADYTDIDFEPTNSTHTCYSSAFKILSATGAQQANWTWTGLNDYTAVLAVFKGVAEVPPPVDIAASWTTLAPLGRDFEYELAGYQSSPLADDNDVGQGAVAFDQLPIGRNYDYQLDGYQFGVVGPDFTGDDALTNGLQDFDTILEGKDFDYQLEGFQQGVVGADADQSNVIPMWFEVPQTVVNYGYHLAPYFFAGVGPDGVPLFSEVSKFTDNPPVLNIPRVQDWEWVPIGPDAAPQLTSNVTWHFDNPTTFHQIYTENFIGFQLPGVGPDLSPPLPADPSTIDELPIQFLHPSPAWDSFYFSGVRDDANFTDATTTWHYDLSPLGKNFDFDLTGFQAPPLSDDNTVAIATAYYELPPTGRNFNYDLHAHQDVPLADENELAYALYHFDLTPAGRNFSYDLTGYQLGETLLDNKVDPVGLSTQHHALPAEGRDFNYELTGYQSPPVGPDTLDNHPLSSLAYYALPPAGRNFSYALEGFQSPPLSDDYFEVFILMGMIFPAYLEPKIDDRDVTPYLGEQQGAIRGEVLPFNNSGPSQYIPTLRPRRR